MQAAWDELEKLLEKQDDELKVGIAKADKVIIILTILHTKTTAALNEVAFSYHRVRGLYFTAVVFAVTIYSA